MNKRYLIVILKTSGILCLMLCCFRSNQGQRNNIMDCMQGKLLKESHFDIEQTATQKYRDRITSMYEKCKNVPVRRVTGRAPQFFIAKSSNVAFCKAPKSGSTFVSMLVSALEHRGKLKNVFHVSREHFHDHKEKDIFTLLNHPSDSVNMVLVTRNPYERLFSAYIDKYFLLGKWGRDLAKVKRKGHVMMKTGYCGYNVTFQEILDYIASGETVDEHTLPVSSLCNPCTIHYDILCKQETFTADIEHVMDSINVTGAKRLNIMNIIKGQSLNDTLFAWISSHILYYEINKKDCSDKTLLVQKLWLALQSRGYIKLDLAFPADEFKKLTKFNAEVLTTFFLRQISHSPLSKTEMAMQSDQVLAEAYSMIDAATITRIQAIFAQDFHLFGYDISPPVILIN